MIVLAIENTAQMSFHYQNLYEIYIDHLLDNYLNSSKSTPTPTNTSFDDSNMQLKGINNSSKIQSQSYDDKNLMKNAASKSVLFTTFPDGKIHFKSSDKMKIKSKFEKLNMANGKKVIMLSRQSFYNLEQRNLVKKLHLCRVKIY